MAKGSPWVLAAEWSAWLIDNALAGERADALVGALVGGGVPRSRARREVDELLASPVFARCRAERARADRLEMVAKLLRTAHAASPVASVVERRSSLSSDELLDRYVANSRPVVVVDAMDHWPAKGWSWPGLRDRVGDVEVELMHGDVGSRLPRDRATLERRTLRFAEFVDRLLTDGEPQTLALEAYNHGFRNPGLAPLLLDLSLDEGLFDRDRLTETVSLWITPRGTFTPLHHDIVDNFFCQIMGQKRLRLVSPLATSLLSGLRGMWTRATLDELLGQEPDLVVLDVTLQAGEALYLPAGWWHEVETTEPSLHLSVLSFRHTRDLSFYAPARA